MVRLTHNQVKTKMPDDNNSTNQPAPTEAATTAGQVGERLNDVVAKVLTKIDGAESILVALSKDPSVDEMAAAIGLTMTLDNMGKHATAIYSGATPNALEFLKPEETFEADTNSLQDFIIALNKEKADHLRYKIEGDFVKVYITPYRTTLDTGDLEYSHGDFNVDLVIALDVASGEDLDSALSEYGRIMHDATAVNITTGVPGRFAEVEWSDPAASSVSEMVVNLIKAMGEKAPAMETEVATALLTGIVAGTDRFSNDRTTPTTMEVAAELMQAGADQQLVSSNIIKSGTMETAASAPTEEKKTQTDGVVIMPDELTPEQELDKMIRPVVPMGENIMDELAQATPEMPAVQPEPIPEPAEPVQPPVMPNIPEMTAPAPAPITPIAPVIPESTVPTAPVVPEVPIAPAAPAVADVPTMPMNQPVEPVAEPVQPPVMPEMAAPVVEAPAAPEVAPVAEAAPVIPEVPAAPEVPSVPEVPAAVPEMPAAAVETPAAPEPPAMPTLAPLEETEIAPAAVAVPEAVHDLSAVPEVKPVTPDLVDVAPVTEDGAIDYGKLMDEELAKPLPIEMEQMAAAQAADVAAAQAAGTAVPIVSPPEEPALPDNPATAAAPVVAPAPEVPVVTGTDAGMLPPPPAPPVDMGVPGQVMQPVPEQMAQPMPEQMPVQPEPTQPMPTQPEQPMLTQPGIADPSAFQIPGMQ